MRLRKKDLVALGALVLATMAFADGKTSDPAFVFLRPETSSFWRTAPGTELTVPVDFPAGAMEATLTVHGSSYEKTYEGLTGPTFAFALPPATSPDTEDVYELTLAFDDEAQTERTARLGVIQGCEPGRTGATRCLAPQGTRKWGGVRGRAVLPIPCGMESFTVNGVETDTKLGGAQGWYALNGIDAGDVVPVSLTIGGSQYLAELRGAGGMALLLR